jgi:hypothetical protein
MVAPKEQSVGCAECHTRNEGRLASLSGFYLPGRDFNKQLDIFGITLFLGTLVIVFMHAALRILISIRQKRVEMKSTDFKNNNHNTANN